MSKYDAFLYEYLVEHKEVSLERMGTLSVDGVIPMADRENPHPSINQQIRFGADKRATTTPALVDFIAGKLQKNKHLVSSDIESYFEQVRQFINIGKSYIIPGVGAIFLGKNGNYDFNGSETLPTAQVQRENSGKAETAFETEEERRTDLRSSQQNALKYVAIFVGLLVVAGLGYFIYSFVGDLRQTDADSTASVVNVDTVATQQPDTVAKVIRQDTATLYKVQLFSVPYRWTATRRLDSLTRAGVTAQIDSVGTGKGTRYRIYLNASHPANDTTLLKDSLSRQFKKPVRIIQ